MGHGRELSLRHLLRDASLANNAVRDANGNVHSTVAVRKGGRDNVAGRGTNKSTASAAAAQSLLRNALSLPCVDASGDFCSIAVVAAPFLSNGGG